MDDPVCDLVRISPVLPSYDNYVIDLVGAPYLPTGTEYAIPFDGGHPG
jgi:hypothetical protein